MSIVVSYSSPVTPSLTTPTAQDIVNEVSQDLRQVLASSGADAAVLLSYVNRVQLDILRDTKWPWLLSAPQRFVTEAEQTDYWIGATGTQPLNAFDTGLNLTDVDYIKSDTVYDRSNHVKLAQVNEPPIESQQAFPSGAARKGTPTSFRHDRTSVPGYISIYPGPSNTNAYQLVPGSPLCTTSVSGALAGRTYFVKCTFVDSAGNESSASDLATEIYIPANSVLVVTPPQPPVSKGTHGILYNKYRVYASTVEGSETLQSVSTSTGSVWTEPNSGLVAGAAFPTTNNLDPLEGYVIEFRYYKTRNQVTTLGQSLLIPVEYKDVVIAGVNALGYVYLKMYQDAQFWRGEYIEGQKGMLRDKNQFPKSGSDFIQPGTPS